MRDMTQGPIAGHLIAYALPMMLGSFLQLTYNAVDSVVIARCAGSEALAAVSTSGPIMTLVILAVSGLTLQSQVMMSQFFGAKDERRLRAEFATSLVTGGAITLAVFVLGTLLMPSILRLVKVPSEAFPYALSYLRIIFVGFIATFLYNLMSASLRAVGDSRTPVLILAFTALLNILLDILFVAVFRLGVTGAAAATDISQYLSALLCVLSVRKKAPVLRLGRGELRIDRELFGPTVSGGLLAALQQAAQPVGKVIIQSVINAQGIVAIGAFNAVSRIDDFACIPAQNIGSAIMTCVAQNRGAGNTERVGRVWRTGLTVAVCYYPVILSVVLLFRRPLSRALTPPEDAEMAAMAAAYLGLKAWMYILPCLTNAVQGYFRGMGNMQVPLFGTLSQIAVRTAAVALLVPRIGIDGEAWGCLSGWCVMALWEFLYRRRFARKRGYR